MSRILLAIDPGNELSAFVVWDGECILRKGKVENDRLLYMVKQELCEAIVQGYRLETVIEQIAHYGTGMPAGRTVFDTCLWIGRFFQLIVSCDEPPPRLIERRKVKMHLCGSARAKDGNVRQALIDRYGEPGTKKNPGMLYGVSADVWQALGLAVTAWECAE